METITIHSLIMVKDKNHPGYGHFLVIQKEQGDYVLALDARTGIEFPLHKDEFTRVEINLTC